MAVKQQTTWEKTKIVATIGPASASKKMLKELIVAGIDVCRLNFSHSSFDEHLKVIKNIKQVNKELGTHISILADLQGPKIRIGEVKENGVFLKDGSKLIITTKKIVGDARKVYLSYQQFPKDVKKGESLLIDDGKLELKVVSTNGKDEVVTKVLHGGMLSSKKGVNLPNTKISMPCLTKKDLADLDFILDQEVEWIALSFVRNANDIKNLRRRINKHSSKKKPKIISKIEKPEAISDIDNIINETDAIMVARGDLGVEIPLEEVPLIQKMLVEKCLHASKPVIIATQMMESMITNYRPTRAEVNDIANAVLDGADAVMLSGETSVGKFPVAVVETVHKILAEVEGSDQIYYKQNLPEFKNLSRCITDNICYNACDIAQQVNARAIIGMTHSGYSVATISSQRPKANIFVFTGDKTLLGTFNLFWGVRAFYYDKMIGVDETIDDIHQILQKKGFVKKGDLMVHTATTPLRAKGKINMIKLDQVSR